MKKNAFLLTFLFVFLLFSLVRAQVPTRVGGSAPDGSTKPFVVRDANTGVGFDWVQSSQIVLPTATGGELVSSTNPLPTTIIGGGINSVEGIITEGSPATANPVTIGGEARALGVLPAAVDAGDSVRLRSSLSGILYVSLTDIGGTLTYGALASPLRIDPTGSTTQPVSGTVSATQGTSPWVTSATIAGPLGASAPAASVSVVQDTTGAWTVVEANSSTIAAPAAATAILNYDSGAGTVNQSAMGIILPGAGGPVVGGTVTNPILIDPSNLTTMTIDIDTVGGAAVDIGPGTGGGATLRVAVDSASTVGVSSLPSITGTVTADTPDRVSSGSTCVSIVSGGADTVIAANPGRKHAWVQVGLDPDGLIRVERAGSTVGCTLGEYITAGTATTPGGQWVDRYGYAGAIAVCATVGTVDVCYGEVE